MAQVGEKFYRLLYDWYAVNHRVLPWRETTDPYLIWLSEVILQQTRVAQGLVYYDRFVSTYPTVTDLAAADEADVLRLWQGLGYYSRARNLHKAARMIAAAYQPSLADSAAGGFPRTYAELRALPGVGDYTAGAIASFAYDQPYPALDGNIYRVLSRLNDCDLPFDTSAGKKYFHRLAEELLDREHPRLFNSAIMEFGALYCVPSSPDCSSCPVRDFCRAWAAGTVNLLPVRKPRPTLRDRYFSYTIYITPKRRTLIHRRTAKDIWQHLYEFPLVEHQSQAEWQNYKPSAASSEMSNVKYHISNITHVLSHQRLHAHFYLVPVNELPILPDTIAVTWEELDHYALSRLTLKAIESLPAELSANLG